MQRKRQIRVKIRRRRKSRPMSACGKAGAFDRKEKVRKCRPIQLRAKSLQMKWSFGAK